MARGIAFQALRIRPARRHEGATVRIRASGTVANTPMLRMLLAEAYAVLAQPREGLNCLADAAQIIDATEERLDEADLHRLRGDLLSATGDRSEAERNYCQ